MNVAIDLSILLHSNFYVANRIHGSCSAEILAGMIDASVSKIAKDAFLSFNRIPRIYLCTDTDVSWRRGVHAGYKMSRVPNEDFIKVSYPAREILNDRYTLLEHPGLEADDWGFILASQTEPCLLVSNDDDWKQMVFNEDVVYFKFRKKEYLTYDDIDYVWEAFSKLMLGCPGDEIPRVLPRRIRKASVVSLFNLVESYSDGTTDGEQYVNAVTKAASELGIEIDDNQLRINRRIANYSMDVLKYEFYADWDNILSQLI